MRGSSAGTQRGHIRSRKRFAAFIHRSPDTATTENIRCFQLHLAEAGVSISNRNRIMTGLRFLFRVTLRRLEGRCPVHASAHAFFSRPDSDGRRRDQGTPSSSKTV
jgi:hypothetical protein